ncbi:S8 family serine peptidase [Evansella sp. LMS18]|uniref:S8 family serine peptidase n=1 Tax=Evansella sp. LMS18 TaxID=2924033 RepID=UPI0020D129DF|nr:S8 family serine peptidase [Evansella sp. LMS18]UTR10651.1 S8 family serine peptidase [Evansella sp. LMS18]
MKKLLFSFLVFALFAFAANGVTAEVTKEYLVVFSEESVDQETIAEIESRGGEVVQEASQIGVVTVRSSDPDFIEWAENHSPVTAVAEDILIRAPEVQIEADPRAEETEANDSEADLYEEYQWDIKRVTNDGKSWNINAGSHDVLVAVIDTGVDFSHPDLQDNLLFGKAFFPGATEEDGFEDAGTHGTHVAGTIAANGRVLGVGPELAIASYRVSGHDGRMDWGGILDAITTAADDGADVANLSLGTYSTMNDDQQRALHISSSRAVRYAQSQGMMIVGANGNNGIDLGKKMHTVPGEGAQWSGPLFDTFTDIPWVISVSSTTSRDTLSYFSNYGNVTLAAPGGDYGPDWPNDAEDESLMVEGDRIYSTIPLEEGGYGWAMGTSMAAPKVAAAIGVVKAEYPHMNPAQIRTLLQQTADQPGNSGEDRQYFGHGIVNVYNALYR